MTSYSNSTQSITPAHPSWEATISSYLNGVSGTALQTAESSSTAARGSLCGGAADLSSFSVFARFRRPCRCLLARFSFASGAPSVPLGWSDTTTVHLSNTTIPKIPLSTAVWSTAVAASGSVAVLSACASSSASVGRTTHTADRRLRSTTSSWSSGIFSRAPSSQATCTSPASGFIPSSSSDCSPSDMPYGVRYTQPSAVPLILRTQSSAKMRRSPKLESWVSSGTSMMKLN
mmetsp:Transcript_14941/g.32385  ORF Transcript_14941/g.32385 Transcript_14941/m.32385 type:complete len:232 (-) Transcript_14941:7-702(-)